ncbi:MAG: hypothetical protein AAGE43_13135 [Pseudomonadota bacterium]
MDWIRFCHRLPRAVAHCGAVLCLALMSDAQADEGWAAARQVAGVPVESRPTDSGFHEHRGAIAVCTDLDGLESFVADTSQFADWIPFTRSVELLSSSENDFVYYVRSTTPWPLNDRDMVYRVTRGPTTNEGLKLSMVGLPDYQHPAQNATRLVAAEGQWRLWPAADVINVEYQLYVHPGGVPAFAANRRLATVVGRTLANLAARFPCTTS